MNVVAGAPLFGLLERSGIGEAVKCDSKVEVESSREHLARSNGQLLASLREDAYAAELMSLTENDSALGRMSPPVPVEQCDLGSMLLAPRFAVEQGLKKDGSVKIRAVDNFSWSCAPEDVSGWRSKRTVKGTLAHVYRPGVCVCSCVECLRAQARV